MVALAPLAGLNAPLAAEAFLELADQGAFGNARVELLHGTVVFKMAQSRLHILALYLVQRALQRLEKDDLVVLGQATVIALPDSAPDPDIMVAEYDVQRATRPILGSDVRLVVEVSVTSLRQDRDEKATLYAEAGIPEYWIINPVARQVEVRRDPVGGGYQTLDVYGEDESIAPLVATETIIEFAGFWPALEPEG